MTEGGLLDESINLYTGYAILTKTPTATWMFPSGAKVSFSHIERDTDCFKFQGAQITMLAFDELTHFSERSFFYMLSRNRSVSGIPPFVRATTNPDADSWAAKFISWWIDEDTGYPIKKRAGVIRYFIRMNEELYWADTPDELVSKYSCAPSDPKSVTFIPATLYDNKILMEKDPSYESNLKALSMVERERLLYGNWKIKPAAGMYFQRNQVGNMLEKIPADVIRWCRGWDLAATTDEESKESAYTSGVLIGKRKDGRYIIADVINVRQTANDVRQLIKLTAQTDKAKYKRVRIKLPQDPGQSGKAQAQSYIKFLAGFDVKAEPESGSKEVRAEPMAAQWQAGNFDVIIANWNDMYFSQLESFPESKFKDMVDAGSTAFNELEIMNTSTFGAGDELSKESYWKGI